MNYIINPSWFYWLNVIDRLIGVCIGVFIISALAIVVMFFMRDDYDPEWKEYKSLTKAIKSTAIVMAVCGLVLVFVPSKQTLIEMQVARYATYDNAQWTVESIKSVVDYIIKAFKTLK